MGYFSINQTGKIKKVLYEDVEELENFIAHHIPDLVTGIVLPLIIVGYLFTVDWRMALIALLPLPLALFMQQKAFTKGTRNDGRKKYHDALETLNGTIVEYVRGMPVVKIFNQTVESFTRLKQAAKAYTHFITKVTLDMTPAWAMFVMVTSSGLVFILPFGLLFSFKGMISLPVLFIFLMLGSSYMLPLFKLAMLAAQMGHLLEGLKRVDTILAAPSLGEYVERHRPKNNAIAFEHVSFGYNEKKVLHDVTFSIAPGTFTALVGPSGAGKTTIAQLLLRMWDIDAGEIRLGDVPINAIAYYELMNRIGFVFQDGFIFSDTVYENIRMGMQGVSAEDVARAATAAQCMEFIERLPRGMQTRIGEGGEVHLSGGEKQRIAIARIFLKNAPVVILDEATAYADAENEAKIQAAFGKIMQDQTVIVIAHRLSTITGADTILVVNDGVIVEQGRHEALLANGGLYHNMWRAHEAAKAWRLSSRGKEEC
jgi:ATP-binding cassette subfamily B protein